jgi:hypothetical protein
MSPTPLAAASSAVAAAAAAFACGTCALMLLADGRNLEAT